MFLTVRLASVEASLDAVNKAMKQAGHAQSAKQDQATGYRRGTRASQCSLAQGAGRVQTSGQSPLKTSTAGPVM